jgi:hypothetical protein
MSHFEDDIIYNRRKFIPALILLALLFWSGFLLHKLIIFEDIKSGKLIEIEGESYVFYRIESKEKRTDKTKGRN